MKRNVTVLSIVFVLIFALVTPVFAAGPTFAVEAIANKQMGLAKTKEITITYMVKDFAGFPYNGGYDGIDSFAANLIFDEDVFYPIEINLTADNIFNGIKTETSKGEKAIISKGSWTGLVYNPKPEKPEKKHIVMQSADPVKTKQEVLQVVLKVKPDAPVGNTTITLKNIQASDNKMDITPADVNTTVEIIDANSEATDPDYDNGFGGYIRMLADTKVVDFKSLKPKFSEFKSEQGASLKDSDFVPTGASATDGTYSYTLIAVGDLNSDGALTTTDLTQMKRFQVGLTVTMSDNQKRAADTRWDGELTTTDSIQLKNFIVGLGDPRVSIWNGSGEPTCKPVNRK